MCVVYVIVGVGQKFQNENVRNINLNNYKTPKMRVINNERKLQMLFFSVKN